MYHSACSPATETDCSVQADASFERLPKDLQACPHSLPHAHLLHNNRLVHADTRLHALMHIKLCFHSQRVHSLVYVAFKSTAAMHRSSFHCCYCNCQRCNYQGLSPHFPSTICLIISDLLHVQDALARGAMSAAELRQWLALAATPLLGPLCTLWPAFRDRVLGNPRFLLVLAVEEVIGCTAKTIAEYRVRKEDFWKVRLAAASTNDWPDLMHLACLWSYGTRSRAVKLALSVFNDWNQDLPCRLILQQGVYMEKISWLHVHQLLALIQAAFMWGLPDKEHCAECFRPNVSCSLVQEIDFVMSDLSLEIIGDFAIVWLLSPKKVFTAAPTSAIGRITSKLPGHALQVIYLQKEQLIFSLLGLECLQ